MKELTYCEYGPKLKRIRIKTQLKTFKTQKNRKTGHVNGT
jgi:hypothetical protein